MEESYGRVTIAPNVLVTIVQRTAAQVPGVDRLCENLPAVKRLLGLQSVGPGVEIRLIEGQVAVDVYLVAKREIDLLQMGRNLQHEVTRAIHDIVGKSVHHVNVHIEDVATEPAAQRAAAQ